MQALIQQFWKPVLSYAGGCAVLAYLWPDARNVETEARWWLVAVYATFLAAGLATSLVRLVDAVVDLASDPLVRPGKAQRRAVALLQLLERLASYLRRNTGLYYAVSVICLLSVFVTTLWMQWWQDVGRPQRLDPDNYVVVFVFLLALQVLGIVLTLILVERVRPGRIETAGGLATVFQSAVADALLANAKPVVIHHVAPFPGLFESLEDAIHQDASTATLIPAGDWARFTAQFQQLGSPPATPAAPSLTVAMVRYWVTAQGGGERVYKGSPLYHFAVFVASNENPSRRLLEHAQTSVASVQAVGQNGVTTTGVIRYWYHAMIFQLLQALDRAVEVGSVELWCRAPAWTSGSIPSRAELGYTFVATHDEAYIGLPSLLGGRIKFEGKHVDFQHEAIRELEEMVRKASVSGQNEWTSVTPAELKSPLKFDLTALSEST